MFGTSLLESVRIERLMNGVVAGTSDQNGSSVDLGSDSGFDGCLFLALLGTLTASQVTSMNIETSSDDSTFNDLEGGSSGALADSDDDLMIAIDIYRPLERYLRPVVNRATANAVIDGVIGILYGPNSRAISQSADVALSETHISPAEGTA